MNTSATETTRDPVHELQLFKDLCSLGTGHETNVARYLFPSQTVWWLVNKKRRGKRIRVREIMGEAVTEDKPNLVRIVNMDTNHIMNALKQIKNGHRLVRLTDPLAKAMIAEMELRLSRMIDQDDFFYGHQERE